MRRGWMLLRRVCWRFCAPSYLVAAARALHLAAQGMLTPSTKAATPLVLRRCFAQMQLLQIDTIHVVPRIPYLVLFSGLGQYARHWLEEALAQGHIFAMHN